MQPEAAALAGAWRDTATEDQRIATLLVDESPSIAAFHAQQAAEKALKAACVFLIEDAPRTHVVNDLLDELVANGIDVDETVRDAARLLERYYAPTRYPDALGGINPNRVFTARDAREAVLQANVVFAFVDALLRKDDLRESPQS